MAIFDNDRLVAKKAVKVGFKYSEQALTIIDSVVSKLRKQTHSLRKQTQGSHLDLLTGVFVVEGPGRFSALRTGVSVANTLAWSLDVPVIGVKSLIKEQKKSVEKIHGHKKSQQYWQEVESIIVNEIKKLKMKKFKQAIIPQYGQEPNISIPKT